MNKKIIRIFALVIALCAMLIACDDEDKGNGANGGGDVSGNENSIYLILANKDNPLDEDHAPESLFRLDESYTMGGKTVELEGETADAAMSMIDAMRADGIDDVYVTSGYRTYAYQAYLFDYYCGLEKAKDPDLSDEEIKQKVLEYSAYPGTSEHQTGLCLDLMTSEMSGLWNYGSETPDNPYDKGFAETSAFEWLSEHAHEYGFILRYPEDKVNVTKYSYESWHYRYVGVEHATKIYEQGITLEEYLDG